MDTKDRPPKPWAPPGWKVHWSKRKTQWYWASPAKKTFWELPADMREPPELSEEDVTVSRRPQTHTSKRQRDEALIEEVASVDSSPQTGSQAKDSPKPKDTPKPKDICKPKDIPKPQDIPKPKKTKVRDLCAEASLPKPQPAKPLDNNDISRMLSSLSSIPGLGVPTGTGTPIKEEDDDDGGVIAAAPIDVAALPPLTHGTPDMKEAPMAGSLSPVGARHRDRGGASHRDTRARADHYSDRTSALANRSREEREDTPSIRMCKHNNWIKSILLEGAALVFGEGATFNAMDLACGRGGDLHKWRKVIQKFRQRIGVFYGIDNAPRAIEHCRNVRAKALPSSTSAHWLTEDLEQLDLFDRLAAQGLLKPGSIHLASMQFALHYFFRSEAALSAIFRLLASAMAEGGIFVATYTDGNAVVRLAREKRWQDAVDAARSGNTAYYEPAYTTVGNDMYTIQMPAETLKAIEESPEPFGHSFTFSLDNAVRNQKEYLVVDDVLDQVAASFGFRTILAENFQPLTHDMMRVGSHQELMRIMKVFGREPELHQSEWDAIGLYKARIFVKDTSGVYGPKAKEWIHRYLF